MLHLEIATESDPSKQLINEEKYEYAPLSEEEIPKEAAEVIILPVK